jgi:hypothetical protein
MNLKSTILTFPTAHMSIAAAIGSLSFFDRFFERSVVFNISPFVVAIGLISLLLGF